MNKKLLLILLLTFCSSSVFAGVLYRLEGVISVHGKDIVFHTKDQRVYSLKMSQSTAKKFDGDAVQIEAIAEDAVRLNQLKVKKVVPVEDGIEKFTGPMRAYQRPAKFLGKNKAGDLLVQDVRWSRKNPKVKKDKNAEYFWRKVKINPNLIDNVYFIQKPFPPEWIAAHCLMLFTFKKGGMVDEQGNDSRGLVLTIEAYCKPGQPYSLKEGFKKTFPIVWVLATWENYAAETCFHEEKKMNVFKVEFDKPNKMALLAETIKQAGVNREGEFYHTTRNNCTNNLVILLNKFSKKKVRFWTLPSMIYNVRATMPVIVPSYLQKKGILGKKYPEVNKDNFFADPSELFK